MQLKQVSATQVGSFARCQRYWYYGWVLRVPKIQTPAMERGSAIHAEIEHYLTKGWVRDSEYQAYPEAAARHLPDPKTAKELLVEQRINLSVEDVGWLGFIDILHCDRDPRPLVLDTKTSSDFRYAKTPEQLREDTQLNSYARYVYEMGHEGELDIGHLYLKTYPKSKSIPKKGPQTKLVVVTTTRERVDAIWARDAATVRAMKQAALVASVDDLPPSPDACGMYGGCPHRETCSYVPDLSIAGLFSGDFSHTAQESPALQPSAPQGSNMPSFLERLQAKNAAAQGHAPAPAPEPAPAAAPAVLPPDAPSRTTPVVVPDLPPDALPAPQAAQAPQDAPSAPPAENAPKRRGRPRKAAQAAPTNGTAASTTPTPATAAQGLTLYIDCMPVKMAGDYVTSFEDWIAPAIMALDEEVAQSEKLPSYVLLPYAKEKAAFVLSIKDQASKSLPAAMIISSSGHNMSEAISTLIPMASHVVKGTR